MIARILNRDNNRTISSFYSNNAYNAWSISLRKLNSCSNKSKNNNISGVTINPEPILSVDN